MPRCQHRPVRLYDRHPDPVVDLVAVGSRSRYLRCEACGARGILRRRRTGWTPSTAGQPLPAEVERWNGLVATAREVMVAGDGP